MKILLTGGGTGGHIIPILAVVSEARKLAAEQRIKDMEFMFVGPKGDFEESILKAGIQTRAIKAGKLRRYFSIENFIDVFKIPIGILQSLHCMLDFKPDVIFSKGGYASVPSAIAGRVLGVPILTHESDLKPGLANKIISFFAAKVFVSFSETKKRFSQKKVTLTGNPVRKDIFKGDKKRALEFFGLKENLSTVLIYGGSQGAKKINETVLSALADILEKFQVIHIAGSKNYRELKIKIEELKLKNRSRYKVHPFLDEALKDVYALCDAVVSRAGANSLSEIIALEKPSVIIPISDSAGNHQRENAKFFAEKEMLIMIEEKDLTRKIFIEKLFSLLPGGKDRGKIIDNIRRYNNSFRKNAAGTIAEEILSYKTKSQ